MHIVTRAHVHIVTRTPRYPRPRARPSNLGTSELRTSRESRKGRLPMLGCIEHFSKHPKRGSTNIGLRRNVFLVWCTVLEAAIAMNQV